MINLNVSARGMIGKNLGFAQCEHRVHKLHMTEQELRLRLGLLNGERSLSRDLVAW